MPRSMFQQYYLPQKDGFGSLTLREVPKISPKYGQILVKIKAVSLNWRDGIIALGIYPTLFPGPMPLFQAVIAQVGIVEEVGEGFTEWQHGYRVLANFTQDHLAGRLTPETLLTKLGGETQGLLGELFIFPKTGVVRIPDYLSFEEASCLPCAALTAWNIGHITDPDPSGAGKELRGLGAAFLALDRLCIVRGVVVGSREQLQDMLGLFEAKLIRPIIDKLFDFEKVKEAYEYLWGSAHVGKFVIRVG